MINEAQINYLEGVIGSLVNIYAYSKADTRRIRKVLEYYGYDDIDVRFVRPMFSGNKALRVTIYTNSPDGDIDANNIDIEY